MKTVLVTGGAGYIGSHTTIELLKAGYEVIIVDNLSNSKYEAVRRIEAISGKSVRFYKVDVCERQPLSRVFEENTVDAVINFAGLKAVGESVEKPVEYYYNNITGMLVLLDVMREHGCKNIVFSSSATVYGNPHTVPIKEDFPLSTTNPYGSTKLFIEYILKDLAVADKQFNIAILRYFNPVGAHESGLIGEDPNDIPNNLCPYITQVIVGKLPYVRVFGDDYDTKDGTGVRDYIHITDLAVGHVLALKKLWSNPGLFTVNLGTGTGYSVLEMINGFSKACGREVPYKFVGRRPGDIATCYADPTYAYELIGFKAERGIDEMCASQLKWQMKNPNGYEEE